MERGPGARDQKNAACKEAASVLHLAWVVEEKSLRSAFGDAALLNDLTPVQWVVDLGPWDILKDSNPVVLMSREIRFLFQRKGVDQSVNQSIICISRWRPHCSSFWSWYLCEGDPQPLRPSWFCSLLGSCEGQCDGSQTHLKLTKYKFQHRWDQKGCSRTSDWSWLNGPSLSLGPW